MSGKKNSSEKLATFDCDYIGGRSFVVGIDEAGRGSLAGPVCAGAVAVRADSYKNPAFLEALSLLDDSKKLPRSVRTALYKKLEELRSRGAIDFEAAFADVEEIEKLNILGATKLAMGRAAKALDGRLCLNLARSGAAATLFDERPADIARANILVDGNPLKKFPFAHLAIVKGDAQSLAIAAASIVAKVTRDNYMCALAEKYPAYGFEIHMGYGTPAHLQALMLRGASDVHRPGFLKKLRGSPENNAQAELF